MAPHTYDRTATIPPSVVKKLHRVRSQAVEARAESLALKEERNRVVFRLLDLFGTPYGLGADVTRALGASPACRTVWVRLKTRYDQSTRPTGLPGTDPDLDVTGPDGELDETATYDKHIAAIGVLHARSEKAAAKSLSHQEQWVAILEREVFPAGVPAPRIAETCGVSASHVEKIRRKWSGSAHR